MTTQSTQSPLIHPHIQPQARLTLSRKRGELTDIECPLIQILAVYAEDKYVMARTRTETRFVGNSKEVSVKKLERGILRDWLRINRGVLINPAYLKKLSKQGAYLYAHLSGGAVYRVSRRHHARARKCLRDWGGEL